MIQLTRLSAKNWQDRGSQPARFRACRDVYSGFWSQFILLVSLQSIRFDGLKRSILHSLEITQDSSLISTFGIPRLRIETISSAIFDEVGSLLAPPRIQLRQNHLLFNVRTPTLSYCLQNGNGQGCIPRNWFHWIIDGNSRLSNCPIYMAPNSKNRLLSVLSQLSTANVLFPGVKTNRFGHSRCPQTSASGSYEITYALMRYSVRRFSAASSLYNPVPDVVPQFTNQDYSVLYNTRFVVQIVSLRRAYSILWISWKRDSMPGKSYNALSILFSPENDTGQMISRMTFVLITESRLFTSSIH
jgi:hypothetical protein